MKSARVRRLMTGLRFWGGYALFSGAITYSVYYAPDEIWRLKLQWVLLAALMLFGMTVLQTLQVVVFLRFHKVKHGWYWPALFAAKKGILNAVLPARTGTLALMHMLTGRYPVKWHEYLRFSIIASIASLVISGVAFAWVVLPQTQFFLVFTASLLSSYLATRLFSATYLEDFLTLLFIGFGLYTTMLISFWCLLNGLGIEIGLKNTSYFATAVNTLAQVAVTPGNMGIREIVTGMVAPYVSLDVTVGVIVGGIFHVVRTVVYGMVMVSLEWLAKVDPQASHYIG